MVKIIFVPCEFEGEVLLDEKSLKKIQERKVKSFFVFSTVQFNTKKIEKQLNEKGIKIKKVKAKRTIGNGHILGCDCYEDSFEEGIFKEEGDIFYIGDGFFHPIALLLAQKNNFRKEIFVFNPLKNDFFILGKKEIENILRRLKRNILFYLKSEKIGLIISTKFGQQYLDLCLTLKKELEKKSKKVFIFVCDFLDLKELENFPFIECWVNSACPRIGFDDILLTEKPLINIKDALNAEEILDSLNYSNE
ncbi:MAG: diphthamide synthesis protein [Candidatus Pacearchaeota archaeon]